MDFREISALADQSIMSAFKESATVTYTPVSGDSKEIPGILDENTQQIEMGSEITILAHPVPTMMVLLVDLDPIDPKQGDRISVGTKKFLVDQVMKDSHGAAKLRLRVDNA
jgi:hypothetical protein